MSDVFPKRQKNFIINFREITSKCLQNFSQNFRKIIIQFLGKVPMSAAFFKVFLKLVHRSHFRTTFNYVSKTVTQFSQIFSKFHYFSAQFLRCFFTGVSKLFRINSTLPCNFSKAPTKKYEIFLKFQICFQ